MAETPSYAGFRPSTPTASRTLAAVPSKDTRPELLLRKTLWSRGLRYRIHPKDLPGKPDLLFRGRKLVVFCDGDFWHGRNWSVRERKLQAGANPEYWVGKIRRNMERDAHHNEKLRADGWTVLRFWESEILTDPASVADRVEAALRSRGRFDED